VTETLFPFGYPGATALYLALFVLTLALHAVLVGYVLAGSGYVAAVRAIAAARGGDPDDPLADRLTDWLPFALGAAITAGVAPLLFLQILYKEAFYTASLLLFHRWMAVVPILIAGFYLLYLGKSVRAAGWRPALRAATSIAAFLCFAFVGYSWTEIHLLALDRGAWVDQYASGAIFYDGAGLVPRFAFWVAMALPVMAAIGGWQLWAAGATDGRRLPAVAIAGLAVAGLAAWPLAGATSGARDIATSGAVLPYAVLCATGLLAQLVGWAAQLRAGRLVPIWLAASSAGVVLTVIGGAVVREAVRLSRLADPALLALHQRASEAGGMPIFLLFLAVNAGVIVWCFRITARGLRARDDEAV
jgi:hypothetical protein